METNYRSGSHDQRLMDTKTPWKNGSSGGCVQADDAVSLPLHPISDSAFKVLSSFSSGSPERGKKTFFVLDEQVVGSQPVDLEPVDMEIETNGNGDTIIPYIDDQQHDDLFGETFNVERPSSACKNGYSLTPISNVFNDYAYNGSKSAVSEAVSADIDDSTLSQSEQVLEYAHMYEQQKRVPVVQRFSDSIMANPIPRPGMGPPRPQLLPTLLHRNSEDDLVDQSRELEKRSGEYMRRDGKVIRRKQPRPDNNVKLSDQIDGYRGYQEVEEVLAFIEGTDASKKAGEESVKRTKKKSGSSADQTSGPSKKEIIESHRAFASAMNLRYVGPAPKQLPFIGPQPRQKKTSVTRNSRGSFKMDDDKRDSTDRSASPTVENSGDRLNPTGPTVKNDRSTQRTATDDDGDEALAKRLQDEEYRMVKIATAAPPEKETFITVSNKKQKPAKMFVRTWVPSKDRAATPPLSAPVNRPMVRAATPPPSAPASHQAARAATPPPSGPTHQATRSATPPPSSPVSEEPPRPATPPPSAPICSQPAAERVQSPIPTGNKDEVLKMLFTSCTNGDLSGNGNAQGPISARSSISDVDYRFCGPAVQYVGLDMMDLMDTNSPLSLSWFFEEEDARNIARERMTRSVMMGNQLVENDSAKATMTTGEPSNKDFSDSHGSEVIVEKPIAKQLSTIEETFRRMSVFVKTEWDMFKDGTTNEIYYNPKKN